ncbi:hypothetical protein ACFL27_23780, partial [candidate division CSSED10-310 bacterium]
MLTLFLFCWSLCTILLTIIAGGLQPLCLVVTFFIATFRRPMVSFLFILVILPLFGQGPGRFWVYLFDALLAVVILQWLLETRGKLDLGNIRCPTFIKIALFWLIITVLQLLPALWSLLHCAEWSDVLVIIREILKSGETSHLYSFQYFLHRCWAICLTFFFLARVNPEDLPAIVKALITGFAITIGVGLIEYFSVFPLHFDLANHVYGSIPRLRSFFGNPGWLAEYICFMIPLLFLPFLVKTSSFGSKIVTVVIGFWGLVTLYYSFSRAAWLTMSLVIGLGAFTLIYQRVRSYLKPGHIVAVTLLLCIGGIILISVYWVPLSQSRYLSKEKEFGSYFSR